jgi:hypothetical protein
VAKKLVFRVKYSFKIDGVIREGVEEESSWYYLDQRGKVFFTSPMHGLKGCDMDYYKEVTPLIKINDEYLSVDEIEARIK